MPRPTQTDTDLSTIYGVLFGTGNPTGIDAFVSEAHAVLDQADQKAAGRDLPNAWHRGIAIGLHLSVEETGETPLKHFQRLVRKFEKPVDALTKRYQGRPFTVTQMTPDQI